MICWQLLDSAFPAGGFAHSGGLEAAFQWGVVVDEPGMVAWLSAQVGNLAGIAIPLVLCVHREPDRFPEIDHLADRLLAGNQVASEASRALGHGTLQAASSGFVSSSLPEWKRRARCDGLPLHQAPVHGLVTGLLGIDAATSGRSLLWQSARDGTSAAIRLGLIGPHRAQALLASLAPVIEEAWHAHRERTLDEAAANQPFLDLVASGHAGLERRLFRS